jgi:hypothetical protein
VISQNSGNASEISFQLVISSDYRHHHAILSGYRDLCEMIVLNVIYCQVKNEKERN